MADGSLGTICENDRLSAHFDWVLTILEAQDCSGRSAEWIGRRSHTLRLLRAYAERGRFPTNDLATGGMLPVFIDRQGTTCAVAELMLRTGRSGLAAHVSARMNLAYVPQMFDVLPADLAAWAEDVGLSVAELSLVQPDYCEEDEDGCSGCCFVPPDECDGAGQGGSEACSACHEYVEDDGTPCYTLVGTDDPGVCSNGSCIAAPEPEAEDPEPEEVRDDDDGCFVTSPAPVTGSTAPVLAALFLLMVRSRRSTRTRRSRR